MATTPDQTAVLELLLGGQSYAELGELLGLDEAEVRSRARSGLAALGGADPDRNVALSDYVLGQADPIGRADAVRHLRQDATDHALAVTILAELATLSPGATLPTLPTAPAAGGRLRSRTQDASIPDSEKPKSIGESIPSLGTRMRYIVGAGALILIFSVLAATGAFSDDDEPEAAATSTAQDDPNSSLESDDESQQERIELSAVGGGDATGEGIVGLTTGDQPYIDVVLRNLEPAPEGQVYVVWFLFDEKRGYPLSPIAPDNKGDYADRFAIPAPAIEVAARMRFLNVSLAPIEDVQKVIEDAVNAQELVITKPGRTVLQNKQPLAAAEESAAGAESG